MGRMGQVCRKIVYQLSRCESLGKCRSLDIGGFLRARQKSVEVGTVGQRRVALKSELEEVRGWVFYDFRSL